ncbi:MAG: hypothetical protein GX796_06380 [Clostridiaceae bacterium]|jgi:hypothetical protein|nr:hypothetical protein [Clostridiaceae bacterium]
MADMFIPKVLCAESIKELFGYELGQDCFSVDKLLNCKFLRELGMDYGIVYHYDNVESDIIENIDMTVDNIIEARFFSEDREIRVFNDEEGLSGTVFKACENAEKFVEKYLLYPRGNKRNRYADRLIVNKYISYDNEDNQAYVCYVAPAKLDFKEGEIA